MLKLFNTLKRKKEEFVPKSKNIGIYFCGPTVYDYAHIGNFRAYVFSDLLRRYLEYKGFSVKLIMNITDVDDKTIKNSKKEGLRLSDFTDKYTYAFFEDLDKLRIKIQLRGFPRVAVSIRLPGLKFFPVTMIAITLF